MHITDTIADMLTRIRNASAAKHDTVDVPASNMKKAIAQILLDEGYIKSFQVDRRREAGHHSDRFSNTARTRPRLSPVCSTSFQARPANLYKL